VWGGRGEKRVEPLAFITLQRETGLH
jgi:hypothetical protein